MTRVLLLQGRQQQQQQQHASDRCGYYNNNCNNNDNSNMSMNIKRKSNRKRHKWLAFRAMQGAYEDARMANSNGGGIHPMAHIGLAIAVTGVAVLCAFNDKPIAENVHMQSIIQAMFCMMAACLYAVYMLISRALKLVLAYAESSSSYPSSFSAYYYYYNGDHRSMYEEAAMSSPRGEEEEEEMSDDHNHFSDDNNDNDNDNDPENNGQKSFFINDHQDALNAANDNEGPTFKVVSAKYSSCGNGKQKKREKNRRFKDKKENRSNNEDADDADDDKVEMVLMNHPYSSSSNHKKKKRNLPREVIISTMYMGGSGAFLAIAPLCMWDLAVTSSFLGSLFMMGVYELQIQTKKRKSVKKILLVLNLALVLGAVMATEMTKRMPWTLNILSTMEVGYWRNYSDVSFPPPASYAVANALSDEAVDSYLDNNNNNDELQKKTGIFGISSNADSVVDGSGATTTATMVWPLMLLAAASPLLLRAGGGASGLLLLLLLLLLFML